MVKKRVRVEAKSNISNFIILIIGGIFFGVISYFLTSDSLNQEYPQLPGLILGVIFGIFALISMSSIWFISEYEIEGNMLIVKSIFKTTKKSIHLKDVKSYTEIEKENKLSKWKDLTIYTDKQKLTISSGTNSNYRKIKSTLTRGKRRDRYAEKLWAYKIDRRWGIVSMIFGTLFTLLMLNIYSNGDNKIYPNQLTTLKGTISAPLKIGSSKGSRWVNLKINEHQKFAFNISGISSRAARTNEIVSEITKGAKVEFEILTEDYEKKISKTKELTFMDKSVNYRMISVYGLRKNSKIYLSLDRINREHKSDSDGFGFWVLLIVGIGFIMTGLVLFFKKRPVKRQRA